MRRVLLHLGLHKTGTTAAQSFLFENRALIWPRHALVLPYRTRKTGLSEAATRYSVYGTPGALADFTDGVRKFLKTLEFGRRRGLILSEENFCGLRPSRNAAVGYEAAPELARQLVDLIRNRFANEQVEITVYLSLRRREEWLRSLWAHDLHRARVVQDFDAFQMRMDNMPPLQMTVARMQDRLPDVKFQSEWLETLQHQTFGPGAPFAAFLNLPTAQAADLVGASRANPRLPDAVLDELLTLNRSVLDDAALIRQKAAVIERAQTNLIGTP